ncbi:MAG: ADP-ribosylation factor-like protein [Candidatus Thorarchaeota archaeon]
MSHFDTRFGPKLFLKVPESPSPIFLDHIPLLLDFYEKGFFIHEFGELKPSNLIFTIPNPHSRGKEERLMISIILLDDEDEDAVIFQTILEQFVLELKKIKDVYKGFYREEETFKDSEQIYNAIKDLLNVVQKSFPKEILFMKSRDINLVLFDFVKEGTSQIAKDLKELIISGHYYTEKSEDSNLLYSKISISEYLISIPNPLIFNEFLLFHLKNKDGFIFVVNETHKYLFKIAELTLKLIFKLPELSSIPSLILFNKPTTKHIEIQKLIEELSINEEESISFKFISSDIHENDKLREAINWILDRIAIEKAPIPT